LSEGFKEGLFWQNFKPRLTKTSMFPTLAFKEWFFKDISMALAQLTQVIPSTFSLKLSMLINL
jgi:hypothetical protein